MEKTPRERLTEIARLMRDYPDIIDEYLSQSTSTDYMVTEVCPSCESEVEMRWDVKERGYKATCPVCGNRLMLCDECRHREPDGEYIPGGCDYDSETDTCHFNQKEPARAGGGEKPPAASRDDEFSYMARFAFQSSFDEELCRNQFRALWTAYCFHCGLDVDTSEYDKNLALLWDIIPDAVKKSSGWSGYDGFDSFMCKYLV